MITFLMSGDMDITLLFVAQKDKSAMVKWKLYGGQKHLLQASAENATIIHYFSCVKTPTLPAAGQLVCRLHKPVSDIKVPTSL